MPERTRRQAPVELLAHLRRARDHIDLNFGDALDLDQLAAVAGISKFHFVRLFEATYRETPIRYVTRRRIERAQDLLRSANLTVTEVCMLVGFASLGSFSNRFTQLVGETPTAYRNRWAASGGPHVPGCYLFMRGVLDLSGTTGKVSDPPAARNDPPAARDVPRTAGNHRPPPDDPPPAARDPETTARDPAPTARDRETTARDPETTARDPAPRIVQSEISPGQSTPIRVRP